jgi:hypothetical protein
MVKGTEVSYAYKNMLKEQSYPVNELGDRELLNLAHEEETERPHVTLQHEPA